MNLKQKIRIFFKLGPQMCPTIAIKIYNCYNTIAILRLNLKAEEWLDMI